MRITPENITKLKSNEVFVFGSNLKGVHGKGAALDALKWGARYGVGDGLQGQTYAIPTKDNNLKTIDLYSLRQHILKFLNFTKERKDLIFLVTPIGCGLAGWKPEQISPFFKIALDFDNVYLPKLFIECIMEQEKERIEYWENLKIRRIEDVPFLPKCDPDTWKNFYVKNLIRAGALPLNDMEDGGVYYGKCRNANVAKWNKNKQKFTYWRHKFMDVFEEDINHFENDNGYDLFVPIQKATIDEYNQCK